MKKPYSHRWVPKYFVRAVVFGVVFLAVLLVLNYLNPEKVKGYDMVFWNSFFTIAMTYCAYAAQIVYSDYKELNKDKAGNVRHIVHSVTRHLARSRSVWCGHISSFRLRPRLRIIRRLRLLWLCGAYVG